MIASILEFFSKLVKSPDIRKKLIITGAILVVYRFIAHVPAAGIDRTSLQALFWAVLFYRFLMSFPEERLQTFPLWH
jgi:preprotein translocase subunit SecY